MSDGLWIIIGIGIAIWWFWPREKVSVEHGADEPVPRRGVEAESASEAREVADAIKAREKVERDEESALRQHHKSMEGVRQKLALARKYVVDAGLDEAIPDVWDTVHYWPLWINRPEQWKPPEGISDITGGGETKDARAGWRWQGHTYDLHFVEKHNYVPDDYDRLGEISLAVDGATVCTISCSKGLESYDGWRFTGVEALTVGPWLSDFVKLAGFLRAERDSSTRTTFSEMDRERVDRMNLGD